MNAGDEVLIRGIVRKVVSPGMVWVDVGAEDTLIVHPRVCEVVHKPQQAAQGTIYDVLAAGTTSATEVAAKTVLRDSAGQTMYDADTAAKRLYHATYLIRRLNEWSLSPSGDYRKTDVFVRVQEFLNDPQP